MYEKSWITDSLSKEMILDVNKSVVIDSQVLGKIPSISLSGGVKTLILIANMPEKSV